ncbi:MAG: EamA family transporter, partial [Candidatus Anstonellaceae archaeon]
VMQDTRPFILVLASAILFGVSVPLAKIILEDVPPVSLAGLLYLGAFLGLSVLGVAGKRAESKALDSRELPWLAGVVLFGGVLAPVFLMLGLLQVSGFAASLFLNLEGVATALIAAAIFREFTGRRFWIALCCMTAAGLLLSWNPTGSGFSITGPIFIILAMLFWGLDNNFTRKITSMEPVEIARVKCFFAGVINLGIGFLLGAKLVAGESLLFAVIVGTFCYGVSLVLFIHSLRAWGAARTGAFFSVAPFVGAVASVLLLNESIGWNLLPAFALMAAGAWLIISEKHAHGHYHRNVYHAHEHLHDEEHQHGHGAGRVR